MTCEPCKAAWLDDIYPCSHTDRDVRLATHLARVFQPNDPPTDEEIGWFMDDAVTILQTVPESDMWAIHHEIPSEFFTVNDYLFFLREGDTVEYTGYQVKGANF